jgi:hypothetical protein
MLHSVGAQYMGEALGLLSFLKPWPMCGEGWEAGPSTHSSSPVLGLQPEERW